MWFLPWTDEESDSLEWISLSSMPHGTPGTDGGCVSCTHFGLCVNRLLGRDKITRPGVWEAVDILNRLLKCTKISCKATEMAFHACKE